MLIFTDILSFQSYTKNLQASKRKFTVIGEESNIPKGSQ